MCLLSIGSDGYGLLWEGEIVGNIIALRCDSSGIGSARTPTARLEGNLGSGSNALLGSFQSIGSSISSLSTGGNSNVFVDEETQSLVIINADRKMGYY